MCADSAYYIRYSWDGQTLSRQPDFCRYAAKQCSDEMYWVTAGSEAPACLEGIDGIVPVAVPKKRREGSGIRARGQRIPLP